MKKNECVVLAKHGNSFIQGHACDKGKHFEFFDVYFGDNAICVSMTVDGFTEIVEVFREIIENEEKVNLN